MEMFLNIGYQKAFKKENYIIWGNKQLSFFI